MATDPTPETPTATNWPVLSMLERRVLGVLVEKGKTTPDAYPLSLNALTNGCNQKSNRDPILDLDEHEAEATLLGLQPKGLVTRITGSRVERWRHNLYSVWTNDKVELSILAELLLRGPQTEGELRTRVGRMDPVDDLESLRAKFQPLADRKLTVWLGTPGRRGTQVTHGFHDPRELAKIREFAEAVAPATPPTPPAREESEVSFPPPHRPAVVQKADSSTREEIEQLQREMKELRQLLERLTLDFKVFKESLGG